LKRSPISVEMDRTSRILKTGAREQIQDYNRRFDLVKEIYDDLISDLILSNFDYEKAYKTAVDFFGSNIVEFAAIDGTEYSRTMLDLIIFYGGACAAQGNIRFRKEQRPLLECSSRLLEGGNGISSCVPMHINEILDIDQSSRELEEEGAIASQRTLSDDALTNNTSIANRIMTLSEFYLAYKIASDPSNDTRIILLDRSLSNMQSSLMYDTSKRRYWKSMTIFNLPIEEQPIDMNELSYGRYRISNEELGLPPLRGDYLRYGLINFLEKKGPMDIEKMYQELGIDDEKRRKRLSTYLGKAVEEGYLLQEGKVYQANPKYKDTWRRLRKLISHICSRLFEDESSNNPLKIMRGGEECWLTTLDLEFITLLCFYMLIEECWNRRILLIGITKDTAARDFINHIVPLFLNEEVWKSRVTSERLRRTPRTDRMLLQWLSIQNHQKMTVPWALVEYDSAYRTMIPELKSKRRGYVSGATRNKIVSEKLFLRSYIQLSEASTDPQLRSNVLSMDRLAYPEFDLKEEALIQFLHNYGGADETVETIMYTSKNIENELQNMVMTMLEVMSETSIPEAFGHNIPLFVADKAAKWHYSHNRRVIDSMRTWIANNRYLRRFIFYMSTFRERRSAYESGRRGA